MEASQAGDSESSLILGVFTAQCQASCWSLESWREPDPGPGALTAQGEVAWRGSVLWRKGTSSG